MVGEKKGQVSELPEEAVAQGEQTLFLSPEASWEGGAPASVAAEKRLVLPPFQIPHKSCKRFPGP